MAKCLNIFFFILFLSRSCWAAAQSSKNQSFEYSPEIVKELQKLSKYAPWQLSENGQYFIAKKYNWAFYRSINEVALQSACDGDVKSLAFALLQNPACRNYCDEWGNHPLLAALDRCRANRPSYPLNDYKACVYLLLACGADPNCFWYGIPLIFKAVQLVSVDLVAALLKAGANATVLDRHGHSIFVWLRQRRFADGPPQPLADDEAHELKIKMLLEEYFIFRLQDAQQKGNQQEFQRLCAVLTKDRESFGNELRKAMVWHEEDGETIGYEHERAK